MLGVSTVDGITPVPLEVNPSTGQLQTSSSGGGGGGTSSTFGAAFPTTGTAIGATNGTDMEPLQVDGSGYLEVNVKAGSGSGLSVTDEATFTAGTSQFVPSGGVYNDSVTALTSGQQGTLRLTANRSLHTTTDNGALETGGNLATLAGAVSSSKIQANITNASLAVTGTFFQSTQPVSLATNTPTLATGTNAIGTVNLSPTASGGWTPYLANVVTTTVTVSGAAGKFGGYQLINLNSVPVFLQCFDTTGTVTLGTTPPTFVITLPANATAANGISATEEMANGIVLVNGLKVAACTTVTGGTTVSTGVSGTILYH